MSDVERVAVRESRGPRAGRAGSGSRRRRCRAAWRGCAPCACGCTGRRCWRAGSRRRLRPRRWLECVTLMRAPAPCNSSTHAWNCCSSSPGRAGTMPLQDAQGEELLRPLAARASSRASSWPTRASSGWLRVLSRRSRSCQLISPSTVSIGYATCRGRSRPRRRSAGVRARPPDRARTRTPRRAPWLARQHCSIACVPCRGRRVVEQQRELAVEARLGQERVEPRLVGAGGGVPRGAVGGGDRLLRRLLAPARAAGCTRARSGTAARAARPRRSIAASEAAREQARAARREADCRR